MERQIIGNVLVTNQRGTDIYTFSLGAKELAKYGRVEHFGKTSLGVQRPYRQGHMENIAVAMSIKADPVLWLEPIVVDLRGDWTVEDGKLTAGPEAYLSIDDGQHRTRAVQSGMLTDVELEGLNFTVTGTKGLDYATRLRIFRMQAERRGLDARLDLAQRHKLAAWETELDAEAYQIVLMLNSSPSSPLMGMVGIEPEETRPYENGSKGKINAQGLFKTVRTIISRRSPLHGMLPAKRAETIATTIQVASEVWRASWESKRHILRTARGMSALLNLYVTGTNFRSEVGSEDYTPERIQRALALASNFDWSATKAVNQSWRAILDRLDQSIQKGIQKRQGQRIAS